MPRWLFPDAVVTQPLGMEAPVIPNLYWASFFGDGTINPKDCTNVAPNRPDFGLNGSGPTKSVNYATFPLGNGYSTNMSDPATGGATAQTHTIVWVAAPVSVGAFSTYFQYHPTTIGTDSRIDSLGVGTTPQLQTIRSQAGIIVNGAGALDCPFRSNSNTDWNMFAWVCVPNKNLMLYNLTTGVTSQSSVVTSPLNRPAVGNWNIGSLPTSTYTAGSRMAFALGALTEMSQSDLINLQRALQYPLSQRGINNV